jgi:hypothetical protein
MRYLWVLLLISLPLFGGTLRPDGLPGVEMENLGANARLTTNPAGAVIPPGIPTRYFGPSRSQTLWVDRNHQYAIAQHIAIAGNGMWIQAGWWLNNKRTSLYRTLGTSTPSWTWPMPNTQAYIPVDVSQTGTDIAVGAGGEPFGSFTYTSPAPKWLYNLPGGYQIATAYGATVAVSDNGSLYAVLGQAGASAKLFLFNNAGDTIRTISFVLNLGIEGLDISNDGSVLCVTTYYAIYVFNQSGTRRDSLYNYGQTPAAISGDGKYLVRGDFSSQVYLYRWSGSAYTLKWQQATGHPWVTSVAISDNGATIMAGTYQYSPANSGKVLMYDSSSATPLWEYGQYGDYVQACALSANGDRGVAGSWGQYGSTFGDVLTVFNKSSATPIFQLLDDVDEPGSIFCVDISKDGSFVTAGGKAVHAREMGNGGEVYAIRILDPVTNDVGVKDVSAPAALLQTGQVVTPQAVVRNYGTSSATFNTFCYIFDSLNQQIYADTLAVNSLAADSERTLNFSPNWTVPAFGTYQTRVFTALAGDLFPANDTFIRGSICYHDGAVTAISYPFSELTVHYSKTPRATIANKGSYGETIPVVCQIYKNTTLVYTGNASSYINALQSATLTMSPVWSPADTGLYRVHFFTNLGQDYVPANDSLNRASTVTTEILYDDGALDIYGYVSGDFYDNKFAVKMIPCLGAPYSINRARFYVSGSNPIMMSLNADSSGLPGLGSSYLIAPAETISAPGVGWSVKNYAAPIPMSNTNPFWMVVHWLASSPSAPYIGMDNSWPMDTTSYWYWSNAGNSPGWHSYPSYDFMMRVLTSPLIGADEQKLSPAGKFVFLAPKPNPFVNRTELAFAIPRDGRLEIKMYDVTGRLVYTSGDNVKAGPCRMVLSGRDTRGRALSAGIYFLKAEYERESVTQKVILINQ